MAETRKAAAVIAWVGIGSNLQDPRVQVARARAALAALPQSRLDWVSQDYLSEPIGGVAQPPFVNAVARLETFLSPKDLLQALHSIEEQAGRQRTLELVWGPRVLDLDLLVYGDLRSEEPGLRLPHPQIAHRAFVLQPMADYDPGLMIPGLGTIAQLLPAVADQRLAPVPSPTEPGSAEVRRSC
ncbi:2-amino-4-hydroxy-6-hydroxymethyldihydropteridine diphosphokinase [Acidithiobacillus sp. YTS05]|uniref:2-amino-4-hydroxy-6- hydroxymethyldihydropteridine diphosphokinase n=1 Tax=Igneacidithiobacillus copahuensis TaxID=2724909 RepID=UPI001D001E55|nr:2-amino-4-hydroxy-6-hydroxymethyldihydropteridine diphosphokinase [Igneacidithiobacillus copahuensis]UTV81838.1 2-amino-4-hydroxy-6-hydroxymethyldihydropteridine diphosphokinase [Acidithiobacillus sp. YTS05]